MIYCDPLYNPSFLLGTKTETGYTGTVYYKTGFEKKPDVIPGFAAMILGSVAVELITESMSLAVVSAPLMVGGYFAIKYAKKILDCLPNDHTSDLITPPY